MRKELLPKSKASQITIFVIIAILLIAAVGIVFVVRNSLNKPVPATPIGAENMQSFVEDCLKTTAEEGLILVGRQGGYYKFSGEQYISYSGDDSEPGVLATDFGSVNIPYYSSGSIKTMPSKEKIEEQISLYVEENLGKCLNDFSVFREKGFMIEAGDINATAKIFDDQVRITLNYPITSKKGSSVERFTSFTADIPARIGIAYSLADSLISSQLSSPANVCLNCINAAQNQGFYTQIIVYGGNTKIFVLTDTEKKLNDNYYDFAFATKY